MSVRAGLSSFCGLQDLFLHFPLAMKFIASDDITTCLHYQFLLPRSKFLRSADSFGFFIFTYSFLEEIKQLIQTLEYSELCILFGAPFKVFFTFLFQSL
jgi:hypothetical protein